MNTKCGEVSDLEGDVDKDRLEVEWVILICIAQWRNIIVDAKELLRKYAAGERDFTGVKLPKARLIDANLRSTIFRQADLSGAILDDAKLSDADLSYANLRGANIIEASLKRANLSYADLSNAVFLQTFLQGANLSHANLRGAILTESSFGDANFSHADLTDAQNFSINRCKRAIFHETIMPDGSICNDGCNRG